MDRIIHATLRIDRGCPKIHTIKALREGLGVSLRDAKDLYEAAEVRTTDIIVTAEQYGWLSATLSTTHCSDSLGIYAFGDDKATLVLLDFVDLGVTSISPTRYQFDFTV